MNYRLVYHITTLHLTKGQHLLIVQYSVPVHLYSTTTDVRLKIIYIHVLLDIYVLYIYIVESKFQVLVLIFN